MWLMLPVAIAYALEMPWRLSRNRLPRWGPVLGEVLLTFLFIWMAVDKPHPVRIATAVLLALGSTHRLLIRKRLGVPAWPPV